MTKFTDLNPFKNDIKQMLGRGSTNTQIVQQLTENHNADVKGGSPQAKAARISTFAINVLHIRRNNPRNNGGPAPQPKTDPIAKWRSQVAKEVLTSNLSELTKDFLLKSMYSAD